MRRFGPPEALLPILETPGAFCAATQADTKILTFLPARGQCPCRRLRPPLPGGHRCAPCGPVLLPRAGAGVPGREHRCATSRRRPPQAAHTPLPPPGTGRAHLRHPLPPGRYRAISPVRASRSVSQKAFRATLCTVLPPSTYTLHVRLKIDARILAIIREF